MEARPFEFRVGERQIIAKMGQLICVLFRRQQEVDYFAVNVSQEGEEPIVMRVFNNVEVAHRLAGLSFHKDGLGVSTDEGHTFREEYGWWPPVIVKETPSDQELEWFLDVNAGNIDEEWRELE